MHIQKLVLKNFRCFENLDIKLHPNLAVIVGANGSGKTSIMEGAAIAVSTIFVKMDGLYSRRIDKKLGSIESFFGWKYKGCPAAISGYGTGRGNDKVRSEKMGKKS